MHHSIVLVTGINENFHFISPFRLRYPFKVFLTTLSLNFQAVEVLRKAPEQTSLLVSRSMAIHPDILAEKPPLPKLKLGEKSPKRGNSLHDEFVVEIKKGPGGLGLSLSGGAGAPPDFKGTVL